MARNYTAELLKARAQGHPIVCSVAPHDGTPVVYAPRSKHDPEPWRLAGDNRYRYGGRYCHVSR